MVSIYSRILAAAILVPIVGCAQQLGGAPDGRGPGGHPDLSGVWTYAIDMAPVTLKTTGPDGAVTVRELDQSARHGDATSIAGTRPSTPTPAYKPEFQAKVKATDAEQSKLDPVFYCGKPGVPRIGPPRKIVQLPGEVIFFYEDISGDPYRIIPTDGRPHRAKANPSHYGDSVGRWEGDTLVVDVRNFVEDTWFGEYGYFHSDALRVVERLWKNGENMIWQATVEDPRVLATPWVMPPRLVKPSRELLEESPKCVETDGPLLLNNDHHLQR
jgi:hypothetical protein